MAIMAVIIAAIMLLLVIDSTGWPETIGSRMTVLGISAANVIFF
jgi:hypothetical protein